MSPVWASPLDTGPIRRDDKIPKQTVKCSDHNGDYGGLNYGAKKNIWQEVGASKLAQDWIVADGTAHWAQNLFHYIFPEKDITQFDCSTVDAKCGPVPDCDEFEKAGYVGAFYLFQALENIHTWLAGFQSKALSSALQENLLSDIVLSDFNLKQDQFLKQLPGQGINVAGIISGAFGMIAGVSFAAGPAAGIAGFISGFAGILANSQSKAGATVFFPPDLVDVKGSLSKMVLDTYYQVTGPVNSTINYVFGVDTVNGRPDDVPNGLLQQDKDLTEEEKGYADVIRVLANGVWLMNNPTEGLDDFAQRSIKQMKQTLAWQMLRLGRGARVFLNMNIGKDDCNGSPNGYWDDGHGACYDIITYLGNGGVIEWLNDDGKLLWDDNAYDMDKEWTYKNAWECWDRNGGSIGPIQPNEDGETYIPWCTFGMEVYKGVMENDMSICRANFPGKPGYWWPDDQVNTEKDCPYFQDCRRDQKSRTVYDWPQETWRTCP